jgi:hypothetical protein
MKRVFTRTDRTALASKPSKAAKDQDHRKMPTAGIVGAMCAKGEHDYCYRLDRSCDCHRGGMA